MLWIAVTLPLLSLEAVKPLEPLPDGSPAKPNRCESGETSQPPGADSVTEARCYALADHAHILMPDFYALGAGVHAGQSRSYALALAPGLKMLAADTARETQAFEAMALALLTYTPKVSLGHAHTLLLEVGSGLRLFGGLRALLSRVSATVAEFGYTTRIACAPTAWGAWLLAQAHADRQGHRWHVIKEASLARVLDRLSVLLLPVSQADRDAFTHVGCATLADLRQLPRSGVVRRFGSGILDLLAQAYGARPDPRESFRAPASFHAQLELPSRVDSADALLFAARRLIVQLAGWLSAHHAALSGYTLLLEHELASRHAPKTSSLKVAWAIPSRDAEHLIWLLREKLNQTVLVAPVIELKLVADQIGEYAGRSDTLFPMPESDGDSIARLLERLSARLGPENVLQMSVQDDHRPERAMRVEAYQAQAFSRKKRSSATTKTKIKADKTWLTDELQHAASESVRADDDAARQAERTAHPAHPEYISRQPEKASDAKSNRLFVTQPADAQASLNLPDIALPSQPRPVWMLDKPLRLMMRDQRPIYRRPLKMLTRTERIEAGWWDGNLVERDYYVAADDRGHMFWVYRERLGGEWYLQGLFG
ncbi:DNA polymerase Y family protein [Paraburkholderia madseniana]|uniref:DNA polymerase Y family protein n=1 Tax=Paraburkholderia madseniana TaxID=2599607 RepID=A0AAP5ET55_9BURK|nr:MULTISPECIES: DNA polymerase Y family protein [Paraburkholderia]MCX4150904.1 DNA polymerase Y family protein [Paraburkholderia madseniana]MDN7153837.1 DNA polymerase Y family protein [Paraburkholderia sp. WS6]MDQ6412719.1 DNA polymerase Y family protein [Paraburkholderia madseniana]